MSEDFSEKVRAMVYPRNETIDPKIAKEKRILFTEYMDYICDVVGKVTVRYMGVPITINLADYKFQIASALNERSDDQILAIWSKGKVLFDK